MLNLPVCYEDIELSPTRTQTNGLGRKLSFQSDDSKPLKQCMQPAIRVYAGLYRQKTSDATPPKNAQKAAQTFLAKFCSPLQDRHS